MRTVLINLPDPYLTEPAMNPPLGVGYLSSYLRSKHFDVEVVDLNLYSPIGLEESALSVFTPEVYGISCTTPQYGEYLRVLKYLKKINPMAITVVGGPHATSCPEDFDEADVIVRGEGEHILEGILNGGSTFLGMARVRDLDSLPFPDRPGLSLYKRKIHGDQAVHIVTLRGCPYNCAFCDKKTGGRVVRYRSVANVMAEVDQLRKLDINAFVIYDDTFTLDKHRVSQFCQEFRWRASSWRCWSRTDLVDREMLGEMKNSGLTSITFGVESGDDGILENINKRATVEDNRRALLAAKDAGVPVRCNLMYGNPGETRQSVENTIKLIEETQPGEWNLAVLTPVPGSAIWERPEDFGIQFDKDWVRRNLYRPCNRFGSTGVGDPWIELDSMSKQEFDDNLKYLVSELERVCSRRMVQDTIQEIKL